MGMEGRIDFRADSGVGIRARMVSVRGTGSRSGTRIVPKLELGSGGGSEMGESHPDDCSPGELGSDV